MHSPITPNRPCNLPMPAWCCCGSIAHSATHRQGSQFYYNYRLFLRCSEFPSGTFYPPTKQQHRLPLCTISSGSKICSNKNRKFHALISSLVVRMRHKINFQFNPSAQFVTDYLLVIAFFVTQHLRAPPQRSSFTLGTQCTNSPNNTITKRVKQYL